jgi:hypothetical protein
VFEVLELMKEVAEDDDSSDISGYHSDSDSAIMMSGNSPYVTKRARYNFLSRSGKKLQLFSALYRPVGSIKCLRILNMDAAVSPETLVPSNNISILRTQRVDVQIHVFLTSALVEGK